jgi:hypothetical protein
VAGRDVPGGALGLRPRVLLGEDAVMAPELHASRTSAGGRARR